LKRYTLSDKLNEGTNNFSAKGNDLGMKLNGGKSLSKHKSPKGNVFVFSTGL